MTTLGRHTLLDKEVNITAHNSSKESRERSYLRINATLPLFVGKCNSGVERAAISWGKLVGGSQFVPQANNEYVLCGSSSTLVAIAATTVINEFCVKVTGKADVAVKHINTMKGGELVPQECDKSDSCGISVEVQQAVDVSSMGPSHIQIIIKSTQHAIPETTSTFAISITFQGITTEQTFSVTVKDCLALPFIVEQISDEEGSTIQDNRRNARFIASENNEQVLQTNETIARKLKTTKELSVNCGSISSEPQGASTAPIHSPHLVGAKANEFSNASNGLAFSQKREALSLGEVIVPESVIYPKTYRFAILLDKKDTSGEKIAAFAVYAHFFFLLLTFNNV